MPGIGPLVWNLAKLGPRNRGARQSVPPVSAQGANQSPTSHVAHRLADARGSAGTGYAQALSDNGVRDGGSSREDACANLVGPSGALVVKAREFAPLASPGAVHYVSLLWFIAILLGFFLYGEGKMTVLDPNAWKKQTRRNVVDSITAVHEAGHVVVRMLAFEESGHSLDVFKAGGWVHTLQPPRWLYADGLTYPQGPISAPFFSYEMEMVSEELRKNYDRDWNTHMAKVLQVSRAAGVNIESWFALHVLQAVSGPIAQALASKSVIR